MGFLFGLEAGLSMELDLEQLAALGDTPPAVDPVVLWVGPRVPKFCRFESCILESRDVRSDTLRILVVQVLEGVSDCVLDLGKCLLGSATTLGHRRGDLLLDSVAAFEA